MRRDTKETIGRIVVSIFLILLITGVILYIT